MTAVTLSIPTRTLTPRRPDRSSGGAFVTSWALVRECTGVLPEIGTGQSAYREAAASLGDALRDLAAWRRLVEDDLHTLIGKDDTARRTKVLLPLRRAVHNGRTPSPALLTAAAGLGVASLDAWLDAHARLGEAIERLDGSRYAAVLAGRQQLAIAAGAPTVVAAARSTSPLLQQAVVRYAARAGELDRRSAKSEPAVLRHVLRAATKTVPLGWFVRVGWAELPADGHRLEQQPTRPQPIAVADGTLVRLPLAALGEVVERVHANLPAERQLRGLAPDAVADRDTVQFTRTRGAGATELVRLRRGPAVDAVLAALEPERAPVTRADLLERLQAHPGGRPAASTLQALEQAGLVVVARPLGEHDAACPDRLAAWAQAVGDHQTAQALSEVGRALGDFADAPAGRREHAKPAVDAAWRRLLGSDDLPLEITEDVLGTVGEAPGIPLEILARLTAVCQAFDWFSIVRRAQAIRFVEEFGRGAVVASVAAYGGHYDRLWSDPRLLHDPAVLADPVVSQLLACRAAIAAATTLTPTPAGLLDTQLTEAALDAAGAGLPRALAVRPYSVAFFVQGDATTTVVNDVYGGWGRFSSRFLDGLPDRAGNTVRAEVARGLGPGTNAVQIRPVAGFAANLHPLVVDQELFDVASAPGVPSVPEVEVVHDLATDEVRLRRRGHTRLLDVLYLGFLIPWLLPSRLRPLVNDLGSGLVDFGALRSATTLPSPFGPCQGWGRLQCGRTVLARRTWVLDGGQTAALVRALADPRIPAELTVSELATALGWPPGVFIGAAASSAGTDLPGTATFTARMGNDRSQFVDLHDPVHLGALPRLLGRYPHGIRVEEALPMPQPGQPAREVVVEGYRPAVSP